MLDKLFMSILDLTKTGSIVILAVIAVRFLLKKAPKVISYALWAVVLFRLLCPVTLELPVSAMPEIPSVQESYVFSDIQISPGSADEAAYKAIDNRFTAIKGTEDQMVPIAKPDSVGKTVYVHMKWTDIAVIFGKYVWMLGVAAMVVYSIVSYARLRRRMAVKIPLGDGVYLADEISFPFVIGILKPKIYLPSTMGEQERVFVLAHERHHIRRLDPLWKALAFLALTLHWFNPLVWVAFILAGKDMEMSCDEAVIRRMGEQVCADYAQSLASLASGRHTFTGMPLAFAEGDPKSRIRNLANWKKPAVRTVVMAVGISVILAASLLVDPVRAVTPDAGSQTGNTLPQTPEDPGNSLIHYDPDRQIYIASENIYMDYYVGITQIPNILIDIYSKEYIDPAKISVAFPVGLPFEVYISQNEVLHQPGSMSIHETNTKTLPYYVYSAYRGADNDRIKEDFLALRPENMPEFYCYTIRVALSNILELDAPVTLEKMEIILEDKAYEAKFGQVRLFPKEMFPTDAQSVISGSGAYGNGVQLYNDGVVRLHVLDWESVPEDITITGLRMLNEEAEILDATVWMKYVATSHESKWDDEIPIRIKKGEHVRIVVMVKNEQTEKLLNQVHLQTIVEFTKDATGEKVCYVDTYLGGSDRNYHEHYAIIFEGLDLEPYYKETLYKYKFWWINKYLDK